ncbi:MAG: hypothetical protein P0Y49_06165 [Candidatus Pedobacter colombiensis]|uniref:Uncharacterized protein n=1 Tax=Candidatus Pedobacter colombiensis TaxID=3121371 RepID=A0AAJ5W9Z3_9SPHI|nr:hypothetical protein [Pedobacter sp.]WEK20721.1 MAG: hypothetical protein P0Y49_06165 [Pedobacter sp.]
MSLDQKRLRLGIILIPAIIFGISLTQNALTYEYQGKQIHSAISLFLVGGISIVGGGGMECLTWSANPIAILAVIRFLMESSAVIKIEPVLLTPKPKPESSSRWLSLIAAAIAWSFSFWKEILAAESGTTGKIYSFEPGYWLWVSSLTILAIGINFYYFRFKKFQK